MSDEKIDHAAEAVRVAHLADNYDRADHFTGAVGVSIGVESLVQAQIAQAHATLALVEQQRIANLIALLNGGTNSEAVVNVPGDFSADRWYGLYNEVRKGLGL